jgi:hypothetical protein
MIVGWGMLCPEHAAETRAASKAYHEALDKELAEGGER